MPMMRRGLSVAVSLALLGLTGAWACGGEAGEAESEAAVALPEGHPSVEGQAAESATPGGMQAPHGNVSVLVYECAESASFTFTVAEGVEKAALRLADGQVFQLDQLPAGSGMEYSDGTYTFRGKGPEATVEKDGEVLLADCQATGHPQQ